MNEPQAVPLVRQAGGWTVDQVLGEQVRRHPARVAIDENGRTTSYAQFDQRANRLADCLAALGTVRGARVAILSENRTEYLEAAYAAAKLGAILCALNWRLARAELDHCVRLVEPVVVLVSGRFAPAFAALGIAGLPVVALGDDYEARLAAADPAPREPVAEPEDGLLIMYTSGTTGLPKGALVSHRAELARLQVSRLDAGLMPGDSFVAWAPMFHMVSLEHALHVLALGGKVFVVDGADIARLTELVATQAQWWLVLIPGMIEPLIQSLRDNAVKPRGIRLVGALADLVSTQVIAQASQLLAAPYWNSFGSTETGMLPAAGTRFAIGEAPADLAKAHNSMYLSRLVDEHDNDVPRGQPGEIAVRGPTVFSGYWNKDDTNAREFRGGWFHMGDLFVEQPDGRLSFADRSKYMIKSGGENIYPMEIERVLLADPRVLEAVVVRKPDARWGEVPVVFVALGREKASADELMQVCRDGLSSYKLPRQIRFVDSPDVFPRSTSGKVQRQLVEAWLDDEPAQPEPPKAGPDHTDPIQQKPTAKAPTLKDPT